MAEAQKSAAQADLCIVLAVSMAPGEVREWTLHLPAGATLADALADCAVSGAWAPARGAGEAPADVPVYGIWGRVATSEQALRDGDRVEVYRPLTVDPKVARRERFARQGARTSGLFARQRPGAKSGY